jgi:hypothetical protein
MRGEKIGPLRIRCAQDVLNRKLGTPRLTVAVEAPRPFVALLPPVITDGDEWERRAQAVLAGPPLDLKAELVAEASKLKLDADEQRGMAPSARLAGANPVDFSDPRIEPTLEADRMMGRMSPVTRHRQ